MRGLRAVAVLCVCLLTITLLADPVRAETDTDGDGLSDSYELATLYSQRSSADGLSLALPDQGWGSATVTLLPWQGVPGGRFAEFVVDHPDRKELTVQVGYWDGSAWVDRYVWDPGGRLLGVTLTKPASNAFVSGVVTVTASVQEDEVLDRVVFDLGGAHLRTLTAPTAMPCKRTGRSPWPLPQSLWASARSSCRGYRSAPFLGRRPSISASRASSLDFLESV